MSATKQRADTTFGDHTPHAAAVLERHAAVPKIGDRLADGRYEVMEVLGEGGMSTVLGAFDREIQRPVAIKILHDVHGTSALLDEARMLGAAQSPGVVAIYALHLDATPPFLVMERVSARALDAILDERLLCVGEALRLLRQIAKALDMLHARGIAHGDVKPGNVLIDRQGNVKLGDLGLAPLLRRAGAGDVFGTPLYIPPERARGIPSGDALHMRGDIYSFGVLAYLLLAHRPPFTESSPHDLLRAHGAQTPPLLSRVSSLSTAFDAPMARALSKDPAARQASAGAFVRELIHASHGTDAEGRSLRVLVVDDDPDQRAMVCALLRAEMAGAALSTASNGPEALGEMAREAPRVLVLDLSMPGMSGITVLERAREIAPSTRAVVVTAVGSGRERKAAALLGVRHFLIKPVEIADLVRAVSECIVDSPRSRDDTPLPW